METSDIIISVRDKTGHLSHHILRYGRNTVGRGQDRDIIIPATNEEPLEVSREHVVVALSDGPGKGLSIIDERDVGQPNLTYINGYSIKRGEEIELRKGDIVSLGVYGYKFTVEGLNETMKGPFEEVVIDSDEIRVNGLLIADSVLTDAQIAGLRFFLENKGEVLESGDIYKAIFQDPPANGQVAVVDYSTKLVAALRNALNERYRGFLFEPVAGVGYRFRKPELEWNSLI